ncbi:hypothetical protein HPB47_006536 [Ixodes persulcatus]|uniref:Uncharacterized protein n=1 Tax=Ixodes persulcatus TaxID=34615 RepID=A0AC60PA87_IXOPE|nr:hypothetical protein HPB47_006536 [Ixodes persulcatus]
MSKPGASSAASMRSKRRRRLYCCVVSFVTFCVVNIVNLETPIETVRSRAETIERGGGLNFVPQRSDAAEKFNSVESQWRNPEVLNNMLVLKGDSGVVATEAANPGLDPGPAVKRLRLVLSGSSINAFVDKAHETSPLLLEGERVLEEEHVFSCSIKKLDKDCYTFIGFVLETSALTSDPHELERTLNGRDVGDTSCSCKAG